MRFYRQLESAFVQNAMLPANTSYAKNITLNFIWVFIPILKIQIQEDSGLALSRGYYLISHQHKSPKYIRCILIYKCDF